jgi:hypothetical protein
MKFFNLDLHISVIADVKNIFEELGHTVDNWSISGHAHIMGRPTDNVEVVNQNTWRTIDEKMVDEFYERYKTELQDYDGFIVTHTPCFSLLYEKFNKPIIVIASTRYEDPFSASAPRWNRFNDYLRRQIDNKIVIPIANNKYDERYTQLYTDREWEHIPSLCEYTSASYTGHHGQYLYSSKFKSIPPIPGLIEKSRALPRGYGWQQLADYKGVVHIPYNISTMSIFEQYTANIPLFFPSWKFLYTLRETFAANGVLSETSWNQVHRLLPRSTIFPGLDDPNNFTNTVGMMNWARLADFYDEENMPHIQYFDSFEHLEELLQTVDTVKISKAMREYNHKRKKRIYDAWTRILERL